MGICHEFHIVCHNILLNFNFFPLNSYFQFFFCWIGKSQPKLRRNLWPYLFVNAKVFMLYCVLKDAYLRRRTNNQKINKLQQVPKHSIISLLISFFLACLLACKCVRENMHVCGFLDLRVLLAHIWTRLWWRHPYTTYQLCCVNTLHDLCLLLSHYRHLLHYFCIYVMLMFCAHLVDVL